MAVKAKVAKPQSGREAKLKIRKFALSGIPLGFRLYPGIPKKLPFLQITLGKSKLVGVKTIVRSPSEGGELVFGKGQLFINGEKIFRIHLDSSNPRDIVRLLQALEGKLPELKKAGFVGFYGYSPNHSLLSRFEKHFRKFLPAYIKVPEKEQKWETKNYKAGVKTRGFTEDYADQEVKGLAIRL